MELNDSDSLFTSGKHIVRIGFDHWFDDAWARYQEGYFVAALALIDQQLAANDGERQWLVYPILFLSRHHLELSLKSLILEAVASFTPCRQIDKAGAVTLLVRPLDIANEHNLIKLWDRLVGIIAANRRRPMIDDTDAIRKILAEFTELDPTSTGTRYGLQKDLESFSLGSVREMSLKNIRDIFVKLRLDLDAIIIRFQYIDEPWWDEDLHEAWLKDHAAEDF